MPSFQKILLYIGGILATISIAGAAWFNNPPWAGRFFTIGWVFWCAGIIGPMFFTEELKQFRLFASGFVLLSIQGVSSVLGMEVNYPWLEKIGIYMCVIGVLYAGLKGVANARNS